MGVSHEELLLEETASREQVLLSTVSGLETETRSLRQLLERVTIEKVYSFHLCGFPMNIKKKLSYCQQPLFL